MKASKSKKSEFSKDIIRRYLEEISSIPILTPEEEIELATRIKQGDTNALEKLLKANLRFVVSVAKRYQNMGLSLEDLINEGNIGLIKAIRRFDSSRGFKFISYAVWWIRQTILQAISEHSRLIRLPLNVIGNINRVSKIRDDFEQSHEREPTVEEIEEILAEEGIDLNSLYQMAEKPISIDAPTGTDDGGTLHDVIPDREDSEPSYNINMESFQIEIQRALSSLEKREAEVIRRYFGIGQDSPETLEQIAENMNLTRERVRQIKEKALRKLRYSSRSINLKSFLG